MQIVRAQFPLVIMQRCFQRLKNLKQIIQRNKHKLVQLARHNNLQLQYCYSGPFW